MKYIYILPLLIVISLNLMAQDQEIAIYPTDSYTYEEKELYHYGVGFRRLPGENNNNRLYGSGYFGIDLFTAGKPRLTINSSGNIGIGTTSPDGKLHIKSAITDEASLLNFDANLIIEGIGASRTIGEGAAIGFAVPSTTDGSSSWQQGRILVTPDNTANYNAAGRMYLQTRFNINGGWDWRNNLVLTSNGNVGVGITDPSAKLDVAGNIKAQEIEVTLASIDDMRLNGTLAANNITYTTNGQTADHVFEADYQLRDLAEVESFINENKHLPDIPSAATMEEQGVNLAEMNKLLLQKVEELTLYSIDLEKRDKEMKDEMELVRREQFEERKKASEARRKLEVEMDAIKLMLEKLLKLTPNP